MSDDRRRPRRNSPASVETRKFPYTLLRSWNQGEGGSSHREYHITVSKHQREMRVQLREEGTKDSNQKPFSRDVRQKAVVSDISFIVNMITTYISSSLFWINTPLRVCMTWTIMTSPESTGEYSNNKEEANKSCSVKLAGHSITL